LRNKRQDRVNLGVIIFTLVLAVGLTWANYQYAAQPQTADAFAPLWSAARKLIVERTNPYDLDALKEFMPVGADPTSRLVYPFYGMAIFLPFGLINSYPLAKAIWMSLMMVALVTVIFGGLSLTRWKPSVLLLGAFVLFSLVSYPAMRAIFTGNPALFVVMLIAFGLQRVIQGRDRAAGVFFGLTILKPTMVALLLPYVVLYAVSHRKTRIIRSMVLTIIILVAGAFAAYPGWFVQNFAQVVLLFKESFPSSISAVISSWLPNNDFMILVASLVGLWVVLAWWRSFGKDPRWFLWTAALTLVLTEFIGIPTSTANYVVFLIPLTMSFSILEQRWIGGGRNLILSLMIGILVVTWGPYLLINGADPALSEPRIMLFLLPIIVLALLYWVRYWALASIRMQVERHETLSHL
jgi:hypothetical protein